MFGFISLFNLTHVIENHPQRKLGAIFSLVTLTLYIELKFILGVNKSILTKFAHTELAHIFMKITCQFSAHFLAIHYNLHICAV